MKNILLIATLLFFSFSAYSQTRNTESNQNFFVRGTAQFPSMVGAEVGFNLAEQWQISIGAGIVPEVFYNFIAEVASQYAGNSAYKNVVNAAFQNNYLIQAKAAYHFKNDSARHSVWSMGFGVSALQSSGTAGIDEVLSAANGGDYTNLKNLLIVIGRSPNVDMNSSLILAEINASYLLHKLEFGNIELTAGLAKVVNADVQLKSGLTNFESTQVGNSLMRQSESDIEAIVTNNGIIPSVGVQFTYAF